MVTISDVLGQAVIGEFLRGIVETIPRLLSGLTFLILAYIAIRIVTSVLRSALTRVYAADQTPIVHLTVTVVSIFL